tara:strand:- start:10170 stop:10439 length:270 start_codon:yes stop_codon:yes gene_type:complete
MKKNEDALYILNEGDLDMKSVGEWVVIKKDKTVSASGIISVGDNIGVVHDCAYDETLIGKKVCYNAENKNFTYEEYTFVRFHEIYGVVE